MPCTCLYVYPYRYGLFVVHRVWWSTGDMDEGEDWVVILQLNLCTDHTNRLLSWQVGGNVDPHRYLLHVFVDDPVPEFPFLVREEGWEGVKNEVTLRLVHIWLNLCVSSCPEIFPSRPSVLSPIDGIGGVFHLKSVYEFSKYIHLIWGQIRRQYRWLEHRILCIWIYFHKPIPPTKITRTIIIMRNWKVYYMYIVNLKFFV